MRSTRCDRPMRVFNSMIAAKVHVWRRHKLRAKRRGELAHTGQLCRERFRVQAATADRRGGRGRGP